MEDDVPTWTLITVTYNSADVLREFWQFRPPADVEWIVVDNASTDDSAQAARDCGATRVIELSKNMGFGGANNYAFAEARGEYVAFVNPDVSVAFDSLSDLAHAVDARNGLVAPQLVNVDGTLQPNGRGFPTLRHKVGNRTGRFEDEYFVLAEPDEHKYICWAIGAAIAGRREVFARIGVWDERFFIYYEDSDICLRAWSNGVPVSLVGDVRWMHGWARATTRVRIKPWIHEFASMSRFYSTYPRLFWSERRARNAYPTIAELCNVAVPVVRAEDRL